MMDAPHAETWEELQEMAEDRIEWRDKVNRIKFTVATRNKNEQRKGKKARKRKGKKKGKGKHRAKDKTGKSKDKGAGKGKNKKDDDDDSDDWGEDWGGNRKQRAAKRRKHTNKAVRF